MQTDANLSWTGLRVRDFLSGERRFRCLHNECFHLDPPFTVWLTATREYTSECLAHHAFAFCPKPEAEPGEIPKGSVSISWDFEKLLAASLSPRDKPGQSNAKRPGQS